MIRNSVFILVALLLPSCYATPEEKKEELRYVEERLAKHITYFMDHRTGLCFAYIGTMPYEHSMSFSFVDVPCDKVKEVLTNTKK